MTDDQRGSNDLEGAVRRFVVRWRRAARAADPAIGEIEAMTAPAFRVLVAERLRSVERDVAEVRARINGLLFVVAGAVITQLVLRLVA